MHLVAAVLVLQIAPDLFDEIRGERIRIVLQVQANGLGLGFRRLLRSDLAVFKHCVEYQIPAFNRSVQVVDRRVITRRFRQTGEERGFIEREFFCGLAEIEL